MSRLAAFFLIVFSYSIFFAEVSNSQQPSASQNPTATAIAQPAAATPAVATTTGPGIYINVGDAKIKRSLLALTPFLYFGSQGGDVTVKKIGTELFNTVQNDLDVSAYFQFINSAAFLEDTSKIGLQPAPGEPNGFHFESWKQIGTEFLIRAGFKIIKDQLTLTTFTYSVPQAKLILQKEYQGATKDVRRIAHTFTSDLIQALTGKKGYFLSKIAVASDRAGNQWREVYVMDWDGHNEKKITSHQSITLSPAWSPDGKSIAYTAYAYHPKAKVRNADLFLYELFTGKRFLLSSRPGINSGACFHPNGNSIFLTISQAGNPDVFSMNTDGEDLKRITNGPSGAMNVEPSISPDGKRIAFSSDRSGRPMIYIMNIDGSNLKRVTFAGRYNASPAWSPDGKKLAFAGWDAEHFDIFVMNSDGTELERLTQVRKANGKWANNEDPTFSPDGRQIMFISDRTGKKQIYIVNVDGSNERRITVDGYNYYKPKWSWNIE